MKEGLKEKHVHWLFLLPCITYVLALGIFPMIYSMALFFFRGRPPNIWEFVGLKNFLSILPDARLWKTAINSFIFVAFAVGVEFLIGLGIALVLNMPLKFRGTIRTLCLLPLMVPPLAAGWTFRLLYDNKNGPINHVLSMIGLFFPFYSSPESSLLSVILTDIWMYTPFMYAVLLAGLQSIPAALYEGAALDGAGRWQTFRFVTLPLLKRVVTAVVLIRLIDAFKTFDLVYIITAGGPGTSSEVFSLYIMKTAFKYWELGYASVLSYILVFLISVITVLLLRRLEV